jgi:hypothetical protein
MPDILETEKEMRKLAELIEMALISIHKERLGFALIVFEFGKPGVSNYVSNAERDTMIEGLKETIERLKNKEDIPAIIGGKQ